MPVGDGVDTIAIDTTQWSPVIAGTATTGVQVAENPFGSSTVDYYVVRKLSDTNPGTIKAGYPYMFRPLGGRRYFLEGEIVGYLKAVSGSGTILRMDQ
jgi:hypothetical protein